MRIEAASADQVVGSGIEGNVSRMFFESGGVPPTNASAVSLDTYSVCL